VILNVNSLICPLFVPSWRFPSGKWVLHQLALLLQQFYYKGTSSDITRKAPSSQTPCFEVKMIWNGPINGIKYEGLSHHKSGIVSHSCIFELDGNLKSLKIQQQQWN